MSGSQGRRPGRSTASSSRQRGSDGSRHRQGCSRDCRFLRERIETPRFDPDSPAGRAVWDVMLLYQDWEAEARDRLAWVRKGDVGSAWQDEPNHPWALLPIEEQARLLEAREEEMGSRYIALSGLFK